MKKAKKILKMFSRCKDLPLCLQAVFRLIQLLLAILGKPLLLCVSALALLMSCFSPRQE